MNIELFEKQLNQFVSFCDEKPLFQIDENTKNQIDTEEREFNITDDEKSVEEYIKDFREFVDDLCKNGMGWKLRDIDTMVDLLYFCVLRMRKEVSYYKQGNETVNYSDEEIINLFKLLRNIYEKGWSYDYSQRMMQ